MLLFWYLERELIQKCIFERNTEIKDVNNCKHEGQAGPRLVPGRERTKLDVNAVWVFLGQNWAPELVRRVPSPNDSQDKLCQPKYSTTPFSLAGTPELVKLI